MLAKVVRACVFTRSFIQRSHLDGAITDRDRAEFAHRLRDTWGFRPGLRASDFKMYRRPGKTYGSNTMRFSRLSSQDCEPETGFLRIHVLQFAILFFV